MTFHKLIDCLSKAIGFVAQVCCHDVALKQPPNPTAAQVQANLQERARAIIEARPDLEHSFGD
jgi:hypothetical protein